jgi:hypothetical protein
MLWKRLWWRLVGKLTGRRYFMVVDTCSEYTTVVEGYKTRDGQVCILDVRYIGGRP